MAEKNGPITPQPQSPAFEAQKGKGRPKGVPNKATMAIKDMVIKALDVAGGIDYLVAQSQDNPAQFLTLVAKVIPLQVAGMGKDGEHKFTIKWES